VNHDGAIDKIDPMNSESEKEQLEQNFKKVTSG